MTNERNSNKLENGLRYYSSYIQCLDELEPVNGSVTVTEL